MKRELIAFSVLSAVLAASGSVQAAEFPSPTSRLELHEPIASPLVKPFADNRDWVLVRDVVYHIGESVVTITVPAGFVTDFASIPQAFWSFGLSPNGTYSRAAIVHDYLYWTQLCTRLQADNILMIAMKESRVPKGKRELIYKGVRAAGSSAWDNNAAEKREGLPKVVPAIDFEFGPFVLWNAFRAKLKADGVKDPVPAPQTYCGIGNTIEVPGAPRQ